MVKFLRPFDLSSELTSALCHYTRLYGAQILLLTVLSAMTVYRRELSVNHSYVEEDEHYSNDKKKRNRSSGTATATSNNEGAFNSDFADELLDGAGNTFSGEPLVAFYSVWISIVALLMCNKAIESTEPENVSDQSSNWDHCDDILEHAGIFCSGSVMKRVFHKNDENEMPPPKAKSWDDCSDDLLEGAGNFCSGSVWTYLFLKSLQAISVLERLEADDTFTQRLPPDIQVHILSFLDPRDITVFSCTSQSCRNMIDKGETSSALWRTIWKRDYAWIVESWGAGKLALLRSSLPDYFRFTKAFYFEFGATYLNYVLAGHNTTESCLVGIHGNVYDLTNFLETHPGSPDTLLVNSGRDATNYFEDMGHSLGARRVAKKLCVVVDSACIPNQCGLHPTMSTVLSADSVLDSPLLIKDSTLPFMLKIRRRPSSLKLIRAQLDEKEQQLLKKVARVYSSNSEVLNGINLYYDPFHGMWKGWYTSTSFATVFLDNI
jgi:hypothetical protein